MFHVKHFGLNESFISYPFIVPKTYLYCQSLIKMRILNVKCKVKFYSHTPV